MAYRYVRQEADALDVVQESILKAYKSPEDSAGAGALPYLADENPHQHRPGPAAKARKPEASLAEGRTCPLPKR